MFPPKSSVIQPLHPTTPSDHSIFEASHKMAPIRVGIIGLAATSNVSMTGSWGVTSHLRSILALSKEYDIVAVANSSVESAQRSIDFHKLPSTTKAYGNPEDIAADPNVDLVVVSVEVTKHAFLVKPAIAHKKALFVEWPLGANVAQAEELTKLAAANSIKTMVGLQSRSQVFSVSSHLAHWELAFRFVSPTPNRLPTHSIETFNYS